MINKERLLTTFLEYVQIDSESTHEGAFAARVMADLEAIGCQVFQDQSQEKTGSDAGNVYCVLPGNAAGDAILFSAHMDTVVPGNGVEPVIEDGVIRSKGETILGGDDKSGVVAVVEALRTIVEKELPHPTIEAVFTVCEEVGLRGSANVDYSKLSAKKAFVLDSSGDAGVIMTAAPGQYKIEATVVGRRAHAGVAPEEGISAVQVLSAAIANMKLLRIDEETTANIGSISADYPTNIVPERASMVAEARSRNDEKLEVQVKHMCDCLEEACKKYGATLECKATKAYSAYSFDKENALVLFVTEACRKAGLEAKLGVSGGGSDANNFNKGGINSLVLGTGMSKVHTTNEEITIQNLEDTAALVLTLATC
ncbi:MAG: M20/M25/M40 family metallo-hydrolase [Bacillota bacterium]|nr:M20/M25/M40 family metallo-hydrolase [Bacillota bacterium]